jgi:hypothetical protein
VLYQYTAATAALHRTAAPFHVPLLGAAVVPMCLALEPGLGWCGSRARRGAERITVRNIIATLSAFTKESSPDPNFAAEMWKKRVWCKVQHKGLDDAVDLSVGNFGRGAGNSGAAR